MKTPEEKQGVYTFANFGYCPCPLGEMIKFSIKKRYNRKKEQEES